MPRKLLGELHAGLRELSWIEPHLFLRAIFAIMLLYVWSAMVSIMPVGFFASPTATFRAFAGMVADPEGEMFIALVQTLSVYLSGLAIAVMLGILIGVGFGVVRTVGRTASPFLNALAATPVVALMPLIVLLLGLGWEAKVTIVALAAIMPIIINTHSGIIQTDPDLVEMGRMYNIGWLATVRSILLPSALPSIVSGVRLGAVMGLVATAVADIYTAMTGLGALLQAYGNSFRMDSYLAIVALFMAIGVATTSTIAGVGSLLISPPHRNRTIR